MTRTTAGFTLIEMMITVAVLGIAVGIAMPYMNHIVERDAVRGTSETIASELQYVRSEAIKRNTVLSLTFSNSTAGADAGSWCFGLDENPGCDCSISDVDNVNACALPVGGVNVLKTVTSESFSTITLNQNFAASSATFSPIRGTVNAGIMILKSPNNMTVQIQMTSLGRIHLCSSDILGYPEC